MVSFSLNPNQIVIDGPAELMGSVSELYTDYIDLDGRRSTFSGTVAVLNQDPLIIMRGAGTTEFQGSISQIIPVRNMTDVPIVITGVREGFTAEPEIDIANLRLEGSNQAAVESFAPPPDFLRIDCSGINESGIYILRVQAGTYQGIRFRVEPEEVQVRIDITEET
jgi:hypothetical protein